MPNLKLARIILFTRQMDAMSDFYGRILGLELISPAAGDDSKTWREYSAGSVNIALHSGPASPGNKGPKITFQ